MNEIIQKILDVLMSRDSFLSLLGGFTGAFFAFLFFIVSERWRSKREDKKDWRKKYLIEHAHLDRYLQYLINAMDRNIKIQETAEVQYKNRQISLRGLHPLPVREESSMRLDDMIFLNKVEQLMTDLKIINTDITSFNDIQNRMNNNIEKFVIDQKREDVQEMLERNISQFLEEGKIIITFQKMKRDEIIDLVAENMFLYKFYKKKFIKKIIAKLKMRFMTNYRQLGIENKKEEILEQVRINKIKVTEKHKKYGIVK